jgi:hypothetical protein
MRKEGHNDGGSTRQVDADGQTGVGWPMRWTGEAVGHSSGAMTQELEEGARSQRCRNRTLIDLHNTLRLLVGVAPTRTDSASAALLLSYSMLHGMQLQLFTSRKATISWDTAGT